MGVEPETGYAVLDGQQIAYQIVGDGPVDIVVAPDWFSAFDIEWQEPQVRMFFQRLGSFARVIRFDRRGSGASDPLSSDVLPPWESFAEDIACVMDEVGSEKAFLWGDGEGGPLSLLFAASHPDRVRGLILFLTSARFLADSDYEIGIPEEVLAESIEQLIEDWGSGQYISQMVPSRADDPEFVSWMARLMRATATPSMVRRYNEAGLRMDARDALPMIDQPTLVLHPADGGPLGVEHGRYLAENLANGRLVQLSGPPDAIPTFALADQVVSEVQRFVTGAPAPPRTERTLATVLFTDIVSSTEMASDVGDHQWRRLLDLHDEAVRRDIASHSGKLVKNTGDGILATFDGPGGAVGFASALRSDLTRVGLSIRTGIHTGEIEQRNGDIGGIAVHLGARIMAAAGAGEILVSRTVKDLVFGSSLAFEDKGMHALKGIEEQWQLYSVITR
jgi:class 3 adenylate cyclase